jgi:hypothetical protein
MNLHDFVRQNPSFTDESIADQVLAIAWFWHTHDPNLVLAYNEMAQAFKTIGLDSTHLLDTWNEMVTHEPKQLLLITINDYSVPLALRLTLDQKYAHCKEHQQTIEVKQMLTDLLDEMAKPEEQVYLNETMICFKNQAFRAAVVMAWNLAYDHLCRFILDDPTRLAAFNQQLRKQITVREDFSEHKEALVLQCCRAANIISKNTKHLLDQGQNRRNMAAHPCEIPTSQSAAESTIEDLVKHVIHKYPLL